MLGDLTAPAGYTNAIFYWENNFTGCQRDSDEGVNGCPTPHSTASTVVYQRLVVYQMNADGTVCTTTPVPSTGAFASKTITYAMHHSRIHQQVTVPINTSCTSRNFRMFLVTKEPSSSYARWRLDSIGPYGIAYVRFR